MSVSAEKLKALNDTFRRTRSVPAAANAAGLTESEAADSLRVQGFDLDSKNRFFGTVGKAFWKIWAGLIPVRRAVRSSASKIPGAPRAGQWLTAWSKRIPVKKSIGALILASVFFAAFWLVPPGIQPWFGVFYIVAFGIGATLIYLHTASLRILGAAGTFIIAAAAFISIRFIAESPTASLDAIVLAEQVRAVLVAIIGWSFIAVLRQATRFFDTLRAHVPLIGTLTPLLLIIGGTIAAFAELYIATIYSGDPSTVQFVASYGFSYLLWALGGLALVFTNFYLLYLATLATRGPLTTRRIAVAMLSGVIFIVFVGTSFTIILGTVIAPNPTGMRIGVHAVNITEAFDGPRPWDDYVHIEIVWANVEDTEGVLNWSAYDYQLDVADARGIEVLLMLNPVPPIWFEEKYSDAEMVDESGRPFLWVDTDPRSNGTRIWEFSFAAEQVTQARENFTRLAGARYASRPSVIAIAVQNEPTYPADFSLTRLASYDRYTVDAFRAWLQARYGTVDNMNAVLGTSYATFDEVKAPGSALSPLWIDWLRLREDLLTRYVERLVAVARSVTTKPITVKIMAIFVARYVVIQTALSERVIRSYVNASDIVSLDLYALTRADLLHTLEYYKALAGNKPIWAAEFNMFLSTALPLTGAQMFSALVDLSYYAQRVTVFTWEPHYLYGLRVYRTVPGIDGIATYRAYRDGGSPWVHWPAIIAADLIAIPNLYEVYVIYSGFANLPVIPWPALLLLLVPIPSPDPAVKKRWRIRLAIIALGIFAIAGVYYNFIAPM